MSAPLRELIESWVDEPELGKLYRNINQARRPESFLDLLAEALVARQLLRHDVDLAVDEETPAGRTCDFTVRTDEDDIFVHVKRLNTEQPFRRKLSVSSRLRVLEKIRKPYIVSVRYLDDATDAGMQRLVRFASEFIEHARVGDELVVTDDDDNEIGGCLIAAPHEGTHVRLTIGLPEGFIDESPRFKRLLRRAYGQFMPGATNVIVVCSDHGADTAALDEALLGSLVERWDAFPPPGRRIAHGRADDGFWSGNRFENSQHVVWYEFSPMQDRWNARLWTRTESGPSDSTIKAVFEPAGA